MHISRLRLCLYFSVFVLLSFGPVWNSAKSAHANTSQYFPQTGHTVSGRFLTYWLSNGSLPVYGYPITDATSEVDPETGKQFLTQWFERTRFEYHPENQPPYDVLGGLIGKDLRREALDIDPDFVRYAPVVDPAYPQEQQRYFPETGHNVRFRFLEYWQQNGGLARFGYPISEVHREVDPETGKAFAVQWFERARFEYHPENTRPYDVLLGLLGSQLKKTAPQFSFVWKRGGSRDGLLRPKRIAVDRQGTMYISRDQSSNIQRYDAAGHFLSTWGGSGTGDGQFPKGIGDLATDSKGFVYALDFSTNTIQKFDGGGRFVARIAVPDAPIHSFTIDGSDRLYAASTGTPVVSVLSASGTLDHVITTLDDGTGHPMQPQAIAVDGQGTLVIFGILTGVYQQGIARYTTHGKFINSFDVGDYSSNSYASLAADAQGNIYEVASLRATRIFNSAGTMLAQLSEAPMFGVPYTPGILNMPEGVTVDSHGNSYFADTLNNRLVKFDSSLRQSQIIGDTYSGKDHFLQQTP